jgi:hypothetical protein
MIQQCRGRHAWSKGFLVGVLISGLLMASAKAGAASDVNAGDRLELEDVRAYLKTCCGFGDDQIPDVVIVDQPLSSEFGGRYYSPGKRVNGRVYEHPTIELSKAVFDLSTYDFMAVIYHEAMHYQIEDVSLPDALNAQWQGLRSRIENSFKLDLLPDELRGLAFEYLEDQFKNITEHILVTERVIERFGGQVGAEAAVENQRRYLETINKDFTGFWQQRSLNINGRVVQLQPADSGSEVMGLTGNWECDEVYNPQAAINCSQVDLNDSDPQRGYQISTSTEISQDGLHLTLYRVTTSTQQTGTFGGIPCAGGKWIIELLCEGEITDSMVHCRCVQATQSAMGGISLKVDFGLGSGVQTILDAPPHDFQDRKELLMRIDILADHRIKFYDPSKQENGYVILRRK